MKGTPPSRRSARARHEASDRPESVDAPLTDRERRVVQALADVFERQLRAARVIP